MRNSESLIAPRCGFCGGTCSQAKGICGLRIVMTRAVSLPASAVTTRREDDSQMLVRMPMKMNGKFPVRERLECL